MVRLDFEVDELIMLVQGLRLLTQERRAEERKPYAELLDVLNKRLAIELALKEREECVGQPLSDGFTKSLK